MQHVEFVQGNDKRQVLLDLINTVEVRSGALYVLGSHVSPRRRQEARLIAGWGLRQQGACNPGAMALTP